MSHVINSTPNKGPLIQTKTSLLVQITVLDKNDSPPSFKNLPMYFSVSEDLGLGQSVATVKAEDPDTIGELRYTIIKGNDGHFAINEESGVLQLVEALDRETKDVYKLIVRAGDGNQYTDATLTIEVTDTNDNPPVFDESVYSFDIPENAIRGSKIGEVHAVDHDLGVNSQLTYTVISDWANDVFSLNPQSGVFTLTSRLDYEEVQHYILVVQAQDAGHPSLSSTLTVYANVLDLNDNSPIFDPMSYSKEIFENASISTTILTVSATDLDSGNNGRVIYSITSGDDKGHFKILPNGDILVNKALDREEQAQYNLMVTAIDQAEDPEERLSSTVQVTITLRDVNDMSPVFITPNETAVAENIPMNTVVMAIKAMDKDEGRNGYIEYLLANDPVTNGIFVLGPVDGLLRVSGNIDREMRNNYTLLITAKDRGEPPRATQMKLFVKILDENDNSPIFDPKKYSAIKPENSSIGASVLQVSATDIDEGLNGQVRYSITNGDTNRDFTIAEDTGVIRVAKNLNYERKSEYVLTVRAEDCAGDNDDYIRSDEANVTITISDINDNPPTFLDSPYLAYIMENTIPPNGGYVITVQAYDADTMPFNALVKYFIKEGDTDIFRINATTGEISLMRALDRELQAEYTLSLVAMDTGSPPLTGTGSVKIMVQDVNDHSPEFKRKFYHGSITENSPSGSWVITATAIDKDAGLNAKIKYSLIGDKADRFSINQETGVIVTTQVLDREETSSYTFTMVAQDCSTTDPKASAVNLSITVLDENDNSPSFSSPVYEVYISDETKKDQFVFGAKATDNDSGSNSKVTYTLKGQHASNFMIDSNTGALKASHDLKESFTNTFNLEIEAADGGLTSRKSSAKLKVFLKQDHLFPRFLSGSRTSFILPENAKHGKIIGKFEATSPKQGRVGSIRYSIAGGNIGDALSIDKVTGEVQVAEKGLDFESFHHYNVWIEAKDSDSPALGSVLQLVINVTDTNDNAPVFSTPVYNASVLEAEAPPLTVIQVSATDADSGMNGRISYKLLETFEDTFEIDSDTGEIYTNNKLDREDIPFYEIPVVAVDHGISQLTGTATVLVTVLDVNDNPPVFTRLFSVNVTENAEIGSFVIQVTSSDQDIGENANATYRFTENPTGKFKIDPISGNVTVAGFLDREQQDEYLLKLAAEDGAWSNETPLTITIQDQNDNAPEFEHSYYSFNFPELQRDKVFIGQVIATDRDKHGPNSVISYSSQQPSDLFTVDPASGEIFSKRSLKYKYTQLEASPENTYSITILATDNGKPPMSSECLVTINVVDSNNNAPEFTQNEYLVPVPKDAAQGNHLLKVLAKDTKDVGVNAEIEYVVINGNGSRYFNVDKKTGWISVKEKVNRIGSVYNLVVRALDKGIPPQHDDVTVTLIVSGENMFSPVFTVLSYQVIVPENEPIGSTILMVNASDRDLGPNGMIRYHITAGNERNIFEMNEITGAVSILQPLDYDTVAEYKLNITARDLGTIPRETTATLTVTLTDINDNAPVFNQTSYDVSLSENLPPGTSVCQLKATDIDSPKNSIILYSISGGSGRDLFEIDVKTGEISSTSSFDYEERKMYHLNIIASNPDSNMLGVTEVKIHITGVNEYYPRFIQPVFQFEVSESTEIGRVIGTIHATDQDAGEDGKIYYLFVGSSNDRGFAINPETGNINVARNLDRETQNRIVLTVMAKNAGGIRGNDTDEAQVIVTVQDGNDPPEFVRGVYDAHVSEGALLGTTVLTVKAVDKDVRPQNNQFSYSIIGGNIEQAFKIDQQSGEIQTARSLDRETVEMYSLIVGAIDTGSPPETGTATVKIHLTDINDNGPIFDPPQVGKVMENEPPGTRIMMLSAKDPDLPPNGAPFSYILVGGKHKDFVNIDKHTGIVTTRRSLDREQFPELEILVEVEDSGIPKIKSQHTIKIIVLDQNDSPSTSRSVHVIVHAFNNAYPVGKIANVHPNDPDLTGDYRCRILQKSSATSVLSIPQACDLFTSVITPNEGYSISVSGNDGKHQDVVSTITVEYQTFTNMTVDNSITLRISKMKSKNFLQHVYRGMLDYLRDGLEYRETVLLYSLYEVGEDTEVTVAIKTDTGYKDKNYVREKFKEKREVLLSNFNLQNIIVDFSPCTEDTCDNGGICTHEIKVNRKTVITDSQNVIFTSPLIIHEKTCQCANGFTGDNCEKRQDPCSPNPCKNNSQCRKQGFNFQCICPPQKDGKYCELERGDVCLNNPCRNGGSCRPSPDGSSFFCLCRPGFRGNQCEALADSCRPNPCLFGGLCVSLKPGYKCSCIDGRYGRHCEKSTYGFQDLSYMTFPSLDAATNDISLIFSTTKSNSLLVYNYGSQTGGRSDFVALELIHGEAVFSFGGARTAITSISVHGKKRNLADGSWHKITATRNGRVVSLSVGSCNENGDVCDDCKPGDSSCYTDDIGPAGTLNFNNNPLYIGGLLDADPILERPGQIHSDSLVGCVHSISVNGRLLNLSNPIHSENIKNNCARRISCGKSSENHCEEAGSCLERWNTINCMCGNNLIAPNCGGALRSVSVSSGGYIEFVPSNIHKRMQLLESFYKGSTVWSTTKHRRTRSTNNTQVSKSVSFVFRTMDMNGVLFYSTSNNYYTSLEIINGELIYMSKLSNSVNMTAPQATIADGSWHNLTLYSHGRGLQMLLDGVKVGEELDSAGVHDFLDPYLTYISLGGANRNLYFVKDSSPPSFEGCFANFTVNNEIQPFTVPGSIFHEVKLIGKVSNDCKGLIGIGTSKQTDPLSIGITLVIVFFVVLLVAILVSFLVFRLRKQHKEKSGPHGSTTGIHSKQNGNSSSMGISLNSIGDSILGRNMHANDTSLGYHNENGDVIRGIGGHSLVGPELLSKKYKDRDIPSGELPRPQRPDIIEREVVSKSPPIRDEHHPPLPPNSNHNHDHSTDMNSELPEHYDLENASSIAPSDIDIVYHYKGYREAGGVRKYKATPPSVGGYHHKHSAAQGQAQHRHSPHHPGAFPPRAPPVTSPSSRPHQTTPLARLSPSSEMSSAHPRILTLHDISGKPLQSALLATTSSSGGVGKDALNSNSERSLNSPVMSQLSGQSSGSRKGQVPVPASNPSPGMTLTAEELERLNGRPRNSSLVSTLDAVSSSSEAPRGNVNNHLNHLRRSPVPETHHSSTTTDESGNDSFTCSEIEYDNSSITGDKYKTNESEPMRNNSSSSSKNNVLPPSYDGFDSSYRGSMSTLVASDDEMGNGQMYRPSTGSPSTATLGWDYFLNWGPNFDSLAGVFKDIAELPESVNSRVPSSLRLANAPKPSEEYV
ncbi:hypothetical protein WA026_019169 [Henosepilachna vigintioctopunctata]|uniref:Cadherin-related tumor suppressor n=1 Tax=Henosepilachna vigintioctopunctata TaxID=420089 RepID=A0AAW1V1J4_9CUCU